jgi:hypothetical protein
MNEHADQLREAFQSHEHLAPDAAGVYTRVQEKARAYRRRRRGAQAAGGAVLGAGLVAGGFAVTGGSRSDVVVVQAPAAAPASTPSPTGSPTEAELQKDYDAYFAAGYGYDDALKLAKVWGLKSEPGAVKAEAGRRLLAGEILPIKPGPESAPVGSKQDKAVDAFFAAGYNYDDAVKLAKLWHTKDVYQVKADAGQKLLDGKKLPIAP